MLMLTGFRQFGQFMGLKFICDSERASLRPECSNHRELVVVSDLIIVYNRIIFQWPAQSPDHSLFTASLIDYIGLTPSCRDVIRNVRSLPTGCLLTNEHCNCTCYGHTATE